MTRKKGNAASNAANRIDGFEAAATEEIVAVARAAMKDGEHAALAVRHAFPLIPWRVAVEACRIATGESTNAFWLAAREAADDLDAGRKRRVQ